MLRRRLDPPRDIFPINDWALAVVGYRREVFEQYIGQAETMFALANGYLGMRGTHEEDRPCGRRRQHDAGSAHRVDRRHLARPGHGFGGMRDYGGHISFRPRLPGDWRRLCFRLTIRDSFIQVDIRPDQTTYMLREGPGLHFAHEGEPVELREGAPSISCSTSTAAPEEAAAEVGATT
jgi:trehalose/maltose hydrolase-like predicted phosphorylase